MRGETMKREFIYAQNFDKSWKAIGLSDESLRELENMILEKPDIGDLIPGTGGLRKTRFRIDKSGKSGGIRVLYVDFEFYETTTFLYAYLKKELENITDQQKQMFRRVNNAILMQLSRGRRRK